MNDQVAIRSSYKVFMESIAGKDFIAHLLTLEASAQGRGIKSEGIEQKALAMQEIGTLYHLRTFLSDMSKPALSPQKRSVGSK